MAVESDRSVWTWGKAEKEGSYIPERIAGLTDVTSTAEGSHGDFALWSRTMEVYGHGEPTSKGNWAEADKSDIPVQISGLSSIKAVTAGVTFGP